MKSPATPHSSPNVERRVRFLLFLLILLVLGFTSGARIVSSDEVSMFLTIESIVQHGQLDIPPGSPNCSVVDGKCYTWYEAGNILTGIPLYLVGVGAQHIVPLSQSAASMLPRATVSLTSALLAGCIGLLFFSLCRSFGMGIRFSTGMTLALLFGTCMFPYFKSFLREALLSLCLLGGFVFAVRAKDSPERRTLLIASGLLAGYGMLTKLVFAVNAIPLAVYVMLASSKRTSWNERIVDLLYFGVPVAIVGGGGTALYNIFRFGNPLNLGYTGGTSFSTPLLTGMFGLLLSPGKGLCWFAPPLLLLLWLAKPFWKEHRAEALCIAGIALLNLPLYCKYVAWGGDGSWGPRYMIPLIPLLFLPVALALSKGTVALRRIGMVLIAAGVLVQIGGVAIYPGAYIQEIGEFPYQRGFDDPEFLARTHFIPDFSPIVGQWKMALRNGSEYLRGEYPRLTLDAEHEGQRLPVAEESKGKLLHTLDFWFTYALAAGLPATPILALAAILLLCCALCAVALCRACSHEELTNDCPTS